MEDTRNKGLVWETFLNRFGLNAEQIPFRQPNVNSSVLLKSVAGEKLQFRHFRFSVFGWLPVSAFVGFEKVFFAWIKNH